MEGKKIFYKIKVERREKSSGKRSRAKPRKQLWRSYYLTTCLSLFLSFSLLMCVCMCIFSHFVSVVSSATRKKSGIKKRKRAGEKRSRHAHNQQAQGRQLRKTVGNGAEREETKKIKKINVSLLSIISLSSYSM